VYRWSGSAWQLLGGGVVPGGADTNNISAGLALDGSGAPVVSWMSLVYVDGSTYWWTAKVARLSRDGWEVLPGFHPDGRAAGNVSSVALVDGVPYLACNEAAKPGSAGAPTAVVLRRWDGAAWQTALETGLQGLPSLGVAGGRAALSVAVVTASEIPSSGTIHVFTREPAGAWGEIVALARPVDAVIWDHRWELPAAVAPGPTDAVVVRTDAGALRMDFRRPAEEWSSWGTPRLAGARQVWPAIVEGYDGMYRVAHVERGAESDWLELTTYNLAP
jgi:hypothetical protein